MSELTLVLEAASGTGSMALLRGSALVAEASVPMRGQDGERMMPAIVELLRGAGAATTRLGRITCGAGPGGFTSLRIAAAIGKGLAESLGIPLWSVSSLALLAAPALGVVRAGEVPVGDVSAGAAGAAAPADVIAVLDAMRGEWHARQFGRDADGTLVARGDERLVGGDALAGWAAATGAVVVGVGGERFIGGRAAVPQARDVVHLPEGALLHAVDLAAWEPDYGRLAEAQVKWEQAHGRPLGSAR